MRYTLLLYIILFAFSCSVIDRIEEPERRYYYDIKSIRIISIEQKKNYQKITALSYPNPDYLIFWNEYAKDYRIYNDSILRFDKELKYIAHWKINKQFKIK